MSKRIPVNRHKARKFANRHKKVRSINFGAGRGGGGL